MILHAHDELRPVAGSHAAAVAAAAKGAVTAVVHEHVVECFLQDVRPGRNPDSSRRVRRSTVHGR